ncbi:polymorphic toxin-type HINT domain-containing protein, partial [Kitasatospora sp. MY 5-36]|uniref:polymorphic toxin-type HINT domain-containing protein n=1 Tax=Kitasatospora sp. MY 5-36 TaxID=1678027 RepID=UPI000670F7D0
AKAVYSANQAENSARQARWSAADANESASAARASAEAAGKDAQAAQTAADDAHANYQVKYDAEEKARLAKLEAERKEAEKQAQAEKEKQDAIAGIEEEIKKAKEDSDNVSYLYHLFSESVHLTLDVIGGAGGVIAPGLADIADLVNCAYYAVEGRTTEALTSCIGAIPFIGDGAAVAKLAQWAKKFGSWGEKAVEFIQKLVTRLPTECLLNSFPAGTRVLMADGSTRAIETVRIGDEVLATDPTTGLTGPRRVTDTIYTPDDRDFTDISLGAGKSLTSTDHHPFWSENRKQWTDAAALKPGDELRDPAGRPQRVEDVRHWNTLQPAYNLTVDDLHTYYVQAGDLPVLVHNAKNYCPKRLALGVTVDDDGKLILDAFAKSDAIKAKSYHDFPRGTNWMETVREALTPGKKTEIFFNLDEIGKANAREWAEKFGDLADPSKHWTAWELKMIRESPKEVRDRVKWYENGVETTSPFD